eukprot:1317559-Heterocapsa_arctica.AAC.1
MKWNAFRQPSSKSAVGIGTDDRQSSRRQVANLLGDPVGKEVVVFGMLGSFSRKVDTDEGDADALALFDTHQPSTTLKT